MHTYKDAIRKNEGSYVLYPGTEPVYTKTGFMRLFPDLGAFAIRQQTKIRSKEVKKFLNDSSHHFLNRASQREKMSFIRHMKTHLDKKSNQMIEICRKPMEKTGDLLPERILCFSRFLQDADHLNWIISKQVI